jgi:septal ring factor EnvC (AmiA/AmiB activator)
MQKIVLFLLLASCGLRMTPNVVELSPTKQKQKIALLQKKLQLAEKEQSKLQTHIEKLSDDMRETELAYIRRQIDEYEDLIRKRPSKKGDFDRADLFLAERERLHRIIQDGESAYEAQVVLDRILQLITELSNQFE